MATLEELYDRAVADEAEAQAWGRALGEPEGVAAFLAARGCDATPEQAEEFLQARLAPEGELADEELDSVAGGCGGSSGGGSTDSSLDEVVLQQACWTICKKCGKGFWYGKGYDESCPSCGTQP